MSLNTEAVLDRRRLTRALSRWRIVAIIAAALALGALAFGGERTLAALSSQPQIARIEISGLITDDRKQLKMLRSVAKDKSVKAVLLAVNSPGGTTTGGEALYETLRDVAKKKPVVAVFGTIATSAAYIVGLASDRIYARGNSITGSVGVLFQWAEVSGLMEKLGVKMHVVKSGHLKATPSMFEPLDAAGRALTEQMVKESQVWFLGLVKTRRGIATAGVPGLEAGRVYSGREALRYKLIDAIGSQGDAIGWLQDKRGIAKNLKVVDWKPQRDGQLSWLGKLTGSLAQMLGLDPARIAAAFGLNAKFGALRLDGLVSVWQPSEN
jgi:protease-4